MLRSIIFGSLLSCSVLLGAHGARAQACADGSRTMLASGSSACRAYDHDPVSCGIAWAVTQSTGQAVSCFYASSASTCQGCGPTNQAAGACINTCAAAPSSVPAGSAPWISALALTLLVVAAAAFRRAARSSR